MKLKKLTEEEKDQYASICDNEGVYYVIFEGGWIKPEDILSNKKDIERVKKAIATVKKYVGSIPSY